MRESDQASIIDGALQLARGGALTEQTFYNYDLLFGTYWIVALGYKLGSLANYTTDLPSYIDSLVLGGNLVCCIVLLASLWTLVLANKSKGFTQNVVFLIVLLSPVLLFSAPLCSPAICSAAFLIWLIALLNTTRLGKSVFPLLCLRETVGHGNWCHFSNRGWEIHFSLRNAPTRSLFHSPSFHCLFCLWSRNNLSSLLHNPWARLCTMGSETFLFSPPLRNRISRADAVLHYCILHASLPSHLHRPNSGHLIF